MNYVMMYSAVASVHALALVCIRYQLFASGLEFVTVDLSTDPQLPVWSSAWDNDCDGVLSAAVVPFLILTPMQTYSSIFKTPVERLSHNFSSGAYYYSSA
jgi:hypothetical protein